MFSRFQINPGIAGYLSLLKIKVTCRFYEIYFKTDAQINITIATPVLLARCARCPRLEGL